MAANSTMLALGTPAPFFALPEPATGATIAVDSFSAPALLVMFICNHCPYVMHVRAGLVQLRADYSPADLAMVAISANDPESHPGDAPERIAEEVDAQGYRFPYLFDETQQTALAYTAACTPDFFLFGSDRRLAYRGRLDASRPGNDIPVSGEDLRRAIDAVLAGKPAPAEQYPSMGCSIKWRPGNAPAYA